MEKIRFNDFFLMFSFKIFNLKWLKINQEVYIMMLKEIKFNFILIVLLVIGVFSIFSCDGEKDKQNEASDNVETIADDNADVNVNNKSEQDDSGNESTSDDQLANNSNDVDDIKEIELITGEWPPFVTEKEEGYGISSEIITAAFNEVGIKTNYKFYPWKRGLNMVEEGEAFGTFPYLMTEDRKDKFIYTKPLNDSTGNLFYYKPNHKKSDFVWEGDYNTLRPHKIAEIQGYNTNKDVRKAGAGDLLEYAENEEIAFNKMIHGRTDLVVQNYIAGWQIIKEHFPDEVDNFDILDYPTDRAYHYILVSKKYPKAEKLTDKFNKGLDMIVENGKYQEILEKHGIGLWNAYQNQNKVKLDISEITLVTGEWAPFTSESMEGNGVAAEIVTEAFKDIGVKVKYKFYPWNRCETMVKRGEVFGAIPYSKSEEREKIYSFSEPLLNAYSALFYDKNKIDKIDYEKLSDLKDYTIGVLEGYMYKEVFSELGFEKLELVDNELSGLKMLIAGRIDILPLTELIGWYMINKELPDEADKFETVEYKDNSTTPASYIMVSKDFPKSDKILKAFNEGLKSIKEKGKYNNILNKYGVNN